MLLSLGRSRRLLFFGGKGGVGKTTVSAALAQRMAAEGRRVLLVSTDPAHSLGHLFERAIGPQPHRVAPNLDALELDPAATADAHLREVGAALRRLMPERLGGDVERHLALAREAPGLHEAALLERLAELVVEAGRAHDLIVFDTAPSGHTARLMALPELMAAWTEGLLARRDAAERFAGLAADLDRERELGAQLVGAAPHAAPRDRDAAIRHLLQRRRHRFAALREALGDVAHSAFVLVLTAERLPVLETMALHGQLQRAGVRVGGLVVNKRSPAAAGDFLAARRRLEEAHLATLATALPDLPRLELELGAADVAGAQALAAFAARLH